MSSTIDPAKLKVVDLRSELTARGLDSKGNKAALVKRLKDALEQELKQELPNTSIADTSTEDLDTSQGDEKPHEQSTKENDKPSTEEKMETDEQKGDTTAEKVKHTKSDAKSEKSKQGATSSENSKSVRDDDAETKVDTGDKAKLPKTETESKDAKGQKTEENGEYSEQIENKKSSEETDDQPGTSKQEGELDQKGEKRKRTSPSPERSQRRRSRSPVKEDEPTIDNDKVQLSWYDSDLHLQLDKESFLSAKPLTEGAFGYAWAGVRATHGVSSGKVCYEVKLVEELKWDDFSKHHEQRGGRERYRTDHRKNQKRDKDKKDSDKRSGKSKSENEENKDEKVNKDEKPTEEKDNSAEKEETQVKEETGEKVDDNPTEAEDKSIDNKSKEPEKSDNEPTEVEEPAEIEDKTLETEEKPTETDGKQPENDQPMEVDASGESKKTEEPEIGTKLKEDKVEQEETKKEIPSEPIPTHLFRVGWSLVSGSLQLGEEKYSYGYESTGKFATDRQFVDYGVKFGVGDVVGAFLDINEENVTITYTVNGVLQPVAATVPRTDFPEENFALFPHILTRNCTFELNLGDKEEPWFPSPAEMEGYLYLSKTEDKIVGPTRPESRGECEVILMCGLPASGKTHWVKEHVSSNIDKRYTVLGNTNLLEKMTVSGEPLKTKYKGRWSMLVDKLQKCLNKLIAIAALRRRNYVIDQTNVFPSAQRRKMRPFEGFKRRAVIVVVGDEEQARRQSLQEVQDGKDVPDSTILEMKAAICLPEKGEWIEEVLYVGLEETEAKEIVKKYNAAGKEAGYGVEKRFGRRDDRWQNRRNDYRGGKNYRERSYHSQRYDPRGPRQGGWSNQRPGGGNWNRDRRDNRGPPGRDWRDQGNRVDRSQGGNYNRNRGQSGGRGGWSSGGGWGGGQGWNQQTFGSGGGGYSGSQNWGNQWKYSSGGSGGQGYGNNYAGDWNYYGQYGQNWSSQGQAHTAAEARSGTNTANSQHSQGYNTQEAWAHYARQYAQQAGAAQNQAVKK